MRRVMIVVALCFLWACQREDELTEQPSKPPPPITSEEMSGAWPDQSPDQAASSCATRLVAPRERLWPVPGELFYMQVGLGGLSLGESAIVVGPQGRVALIDVGNDSHDDDVLDALDALIARMNASSSYPPRAARHVDAVVLTHFHSDHADGLEDLMEKASADRLIHRGFVDLTDAATKSAIEKVCAALKTTPTLREIALCEPRSAPGGCVSGRWDGGKYPAKACEGLFVGDVDDAQQGIAPSFLSLGQGADLRFIAANAYVNHASFEREKHELSETVSNDENARSVVGLLAHGAFRLLFNGDLTGGGDGTADVEGFILEHLAQVSDLDARGVDVLHLGHHARKSSSSARWLDALLPKDGCARSAIMGISTAHLGSPHQEVLTRLFEGGRLGGGFGWSTTGHGDETPGHRSADGGHVLLRTVDQGASYIIQIVDEDGKVRLSEAYHSVRACAASCAVTRP